MPSLFIATGNAHKVDEIRLALGPDFACLSQSDANAPLAIDETGTTFAANARLKALAWAAYLGIDPCNLEVDWVLADDSGLEVDALGGAPGVHSARFAALDDGRRGNSSDAENNAKLIRLLAALPHLQPTARFRCVLAVTPVRSGASLDELAAVTRTFDGTCEGRLQNQPTGSRGFGYDPLFVPIGHETSFATLGESVKNSLSHRGQALRKLMAWFRSDAPARPTHPRLPPRSLLNTPSERDNNA